jgi:hypothetical protein
MKGARQHDGDVTPAAGRRLHLPPAEPRATPRRSLDAVLWGAGLDVAARSLARSALGWKRHAGSATEICAAIVEDCWTGSFFARSAGHSKQLWTRDLAICTPALVHLGHGARVTQSWTWALERFERAGRVTTTIFAGRFARDARAYACDTLPLLLHALRAAGAEELAHRHRVLLAGEIRRFHDVVFDPELGLARPDGYVAGPSDEVTGRSTVFANTMVALAARVLDDLPTLPNPFRGRDLVSALWQHHWMGDHFRDSLCRDVPSGDANVWPFFFDVVTDRQMQRRALHTLEERGFTRPVPLRHFEGDSSRMQLGVAYLRVLACVDRPLMEWHRANVAALIERDGNALELYAADGRPHRGRALLAQADAGMLWASMFLDLFT